MHELKPFLWFALHRQTQLHGRHFLNESCILNIIQYFGTLPCKALTGYSHTCSYKNYRKRLPMTNRVTEFLHNVTRVLSTMKHIHEYQRGFHEHRRPASFAGLRIVAQLIRRRISMATLEHRHVYPSLNPADVQKSCTLILPS